MAEDLSVLYTISFTKPRVNPNRDGDFCVYFVLESPGPETFVTDLALFIRTVGQELIKWSVFGNPDNLDLSDPTYPMLRDLAYSWDGIACGYGVLQFCATPVSVMNIRRKFHQMSQIFSPLSSHRRHEYFASGIFAEAQDTLLPVAFIKMEAAAQYVFN